MDCSRARPVPTTHSGRSGQRCRGWLGVHLVARSDDLMSRVHRTTAAHDESVVWQFRCRGGQRCSLRHGPGPPWNPMDSAMRHLAAACSAGPRGQAASWAMRFRERGLRRAEDSATEQASTAVSDLDSMRNGSRAADALRDGMTSDLQVFPRPSGSDIWRRWTPGDLDGRAPAGP